MKKMKNILWIVLLFFVYNCQSQQQNKMAQWRGDNRDGNYNESNLLTKWPDEGPKQLWKYEGIGDGYGSPVITDNCIYVIGENDSIESIFAIDLTGKLKWKSPLEKTWTVSFPGSRSAPTFVDDLVYVASSKGKVACFDAKTGKEKWSVHMLNDFKGKETRFGYSESLLVSGDIVFCTPGGTENNIVALNRFTGEKIWSSKAFGEKPSFCSPLEIDLPGKKIMVTFTHHHLLGIDMEDGKILWSHNQIVEEDSTYNDVHCNTPIYDNGFIYYATGDGNGAVKLKLADNGESISEVWRNSKFDDVMGGFIKFDDKIIGSSYRGRKYNILDTQTGEVVDSLKFGRGSIISADNMIYVYNINGELGLFNRKSDSFHLVSRFKIKDGTKQHFAHPVINKGVLYIRHGNALLAYLLKSE